MNPSLFKSIVELTSDAVFIVRVELSGKAFMMEYVNDAYLAKFNVTRESVIGKEFNEMLDISIVDNIRNRFIECVQQCQTIRFEEVFSDHTASLSELFPVFGQEGQVEYVVGVSKDITELKNKRDQLAASKHTLQSIINSSDNVLIYVAPDNTIIYANRKAQEHAVKLFGKELTIGAKVDDYYPLEERERAFEHVRQLKEKRKTVNYEHGFKYPNGEDVWFLRRYYGVYNLAGQLTGVVIASINITNRKQQEILIQKHAETLREIAKIQSHEIRRPVANIMGLVDLMDLKTKTLDENEQVLHYLKQSTRELDELISYIVDKTQSQNG